MKKKKSLVIMGIGFLVGVIGYWTKDFSEDRALYHTAFKIMGPGTFAGAIIFAFYRKKMPFLNALMISLGVLFGMLSRIFWDLIQGPTSHNLFPFEFMISLAIVVPAAFLGAFLVYSVFWIAAEKLTKNNI
jgi:hypothetical protein